MKKVIVLALILNSVILILYTTNLQGTPPNIVAPNGIKEGRVITKFRTSVDTPIHILVDVSHGNEIYIPAKASAMGGFLEGTGEYNVTTLLWQTINDSILANVDVLVITTPDYHIPYSNSEVQAIKNYWDGGGSVLFIGALPFGQGGVTSFLDNIEINRIINELGLDIEYNNSELPTDHAIGLDDTLPTHPLTYNIGELYIRGAQIHPGSGTPTQILSMSSRGYANVVVWNDTSNRAVFLGSTDPIQEFIASTANQDPNWNNHTHRYQFMYNIFNWLSFQPNKPVGQIRPIKAYTGYNNPINQSYLDNLTMYTGPGHVHTLESRTSAYYSDFANTALALEYDFIVVADYNTIKGGPILREFFEYNSIPIHVIDGMEGTNTIWHTTGWGFESQIEISSNPFTRIQQFHDQGSPIVLAHPSWLTYSHIEYPRIFDLREYPFDGIEISNSGFLGGDGNLALKYPFYGGPDAKTADVGALSATFNYVFAENISDDPDWWTEAFLDRRIVCYIPKDDIYVGDEVLVNEVINRLNETDRFPFEYPTVPNVNYPKPPSDSSTTTTTDEPSSGFILVFSILSLALFSKRK